MTKWIGGLSERPNWDAYFMSIAFLTSQRSIDPNTCCGAVITNSCNKIVSVGYNGPPPGIDDKSVPVTAPDKYDWFIHAEMNAIHNASQSLGGCVLYVTGHPCENCAKHIAATGIKKVVYGKNAAKMVCEKKQNLSATIMKTSGIELIEYNKNGCIKKVLERTLNYMEYKGL